MFPARDDIDEEMSALLCSFGGRNHRSRKEQGELLLGDVAPRPNKKQGAKWPKYQGPTTVDQRTLGKRIQVSALPSGKYSGTGHVTQQLMVLRGVDAKYAETFAQALNGSKSINTWKQRDSIMRTIKRCEQESGALLTLPWGTREVQWFVGWCMEENLKGSTINQYVSNVRTLHKELKLRMDDSDWDFIKTVIKGHDNLRGKNPGRVAMTPELLFHLKVRLSKSRLSIPERRLMWVVATAMFQGSFRIGELLSPTTTQFCPESTLRGRDVEAKECSVGDNKVCMLMFNIRIPKECRGNGSATVEIFDLDCFYSCVQAWRKWRACSKLDLDPDLPVFRRESGALLTPSEFNACLKEMLSDKISYSEGYVTSHSFRAGLASIMARLGYDNSQIMIQGRWRSDAFLRYLKLGRATRLTDQFSLASKISGVVTESMLRGGPIV